MVIYRRIKNNVFIGVTVLMHYKRIKDMTD